MKGFLYANKSANIEKCLKLEDEICINGPKLWNKFAPEFFKCPKPCKQTSYKDSNLFLTELMYLKAGKNKAYFEFFMKDIRNVEKEVLVYDANDMVGTIGGSLGQFLGFSFFDVISRCVEMFINFLLKKSNV